MADLDPRTELTDALHRVDLDYKSGDREFSGMSVECDCQAELGTDGVHAPNLLDLVEKALAHRHECRLAKEGTAEPHP